MMRSSRALMPLLAFGLGLAWTQGEALAQRPLRGDEPMPADHPTPGTQTAPQGDMPPGHPPVGSPQPAGDPHLGGAATRQPPPPDRVALDPQLPAGSVVVELYDGESRPLSNATFSLVQHEHNVAQGDAIEKLPGRTDALGTFRFDDLPQATSYSFTVVVTEGPATYRSEEFQLHDGKGRRVRTHVFPVVHDIRDAMVGMRGILFLEPRQDVIQAELNFQIFNIGRSTWVPKDVSFQLPPEATAFRAQDAEADNRVDQRGDRLVLRGSYGPGQQEIAYSFQLPAGHSSSQAFEVHLPPRVAELRVGASIGRNAELHVEGFEPAEKSRGKDGTWIALTGRQVLRGGPPLDTVSVRLSGLHVASRGRWVAVGLAGTIAALGLAFGFRRSPSTSARLDDTEQAMKMLFAELEALEELRKADRIGPRSYERSRAALIEALARLESLRQSVASTSA
jgi:hypothetical protein